MITTPVCGSTPNNAESLYGRGLAHLMLGNNDQGNQDIAAARAMKAEIVAEFARYGVKFGAASSVP